MRRKERRGRWSNDKKRATARKERQQGRSNGEEGATTKNVKKEKLA